MSRNNIPSYSQKQKVTLNDKYDNCHKIRHFRQDCRMLKILDSLKKAYNIKQNNVPRFKQHQPQLSRTNVVGNHKEKNSNLKLFRLGIAFITIKQPQMTKIKSIYYLDSYISCYLINN